MDIQPEIKTKVNSLIGKGKVEEALEFLIQTVDDTHPIQNQLLKLQQNLSTAENKGMEGSYTSEMVKRERTLTTEGILNLINPASKLISEEKTVQVDDIESLKAQLAEAKEGEKKSTRVAGLYFVFIIAAILSYLFFKFIQS